MNKSRGRRSNRNAGQCWSCAAIGGLVGALGAVLLLGILVFSGWLANRGLKVDRVACAWDEQAGVYRASVTASNTEPQFKVASIWVQGRFKPRDGQQWPTTAIRQHYEQTSDQMVLELEPSGSATGEVSFAIPGARDFQCSADARLGRQERFDQRPADDVTTAVATELQDGGSQTGRLRRLRGRL